ncbi:MAG: TatD family hydrolase [Clostridiales bacterium]|nr:TatD family hydrolase [Clostridiales bacterium]
MKNIFDSHTHYDDKAFDEDREQILAGLPAQGICGVVNCGSDKKSSEDSLLLSDRFPFVFTACGVHPHHASQDDSVNFVKILPVVTAAKKCVAIGEIGLDYHYDFAPRDVQQSIFEAQLALAVELDLPVVVHNREAHEDTLRLLEKYKPRGVMHCFSGSVETAAIIVKFGMYIGLGGSVTFKNAKTPLDVARFVPAERLLIETDCPYMAPVPFRGKRCTSAFIPYTAEKIAELRGVTAQDILDLTAKNARELFRITD